MKSNNLAHWYFFCLLPSAFCLSAAAQGTAFTYQGRLNDGGTPANGTYDLRFAIYDASTVGTQQGPPLTNFNTTVSNGFFTVTNDFGNQFPGTPRWLEIGVRTNGAGTFNTLSPRQALTPAPYAVTAGNVVSGGLASGTYSNTLTFSNGANQFAGSFTGDGANLTNINAAAVGGLSASNIWKTIGNSGTTPGANFLGTTDNQPLELRVSGVRALRLEPSTNGAPNVVGGAPNNVVDAGIIGATIAGGGALNMTGFLPGASSNHVSANFGTIGGGRLNTVAADYSTIAGGITNTIQAGAFEATIGSGQGNSIGTGASSAVIAGGYYNTVIGGASTATVSGGRQNIAGDQYATVGGGFQNSASNLLSTVSGGYHNTTSGDYATVGGGSDNIAGGDYATVSGGFNNSASGLRSTVPGGYNAVAAGDYSLAAGFFAQANHAGTFVWADDSSTSAFTSTATNQFLIRASGGVGINTNNPSGAALSVAGTVQATAFQGDGSALLNVSPVPLGNYLFAFSSSAQSVVAGNAFQDITLNNDAQINGWSHTTGTAQYTNSQSGLYLIQYSAELGSNALNGTNAIVRADLNSVEISGSRSFTTVTPASLAGDVSSVSKSFLASVNTADVLTLQFTGSSSAVRLTGNPSISLTITRIQ